VDILEEEAEADTGLREVRVPGDQEGLALDFDRL
jgi:hypothetical protein